MPNEGVRETFQATLWTRCRTGVASRMRFLAVSDESKPGTLASGCVTYAGLLAPASAWESHFIPEWRARVLDSEPRIDRFHTVELRDPRKTGLSRDQCETKIAAAWRVIDGADYFSIVSAEARHEHFNSSHTGLDLDIPGRRRQGFRPEHLVFSHYLLNVMRVVAGNHPEADSVDFVVEGAGSEQDAALVSLFHSTKRTSLPGLGLQDIAGRMGTITVRGKDYLPLQGADLIAWYARRIADGGHLSAAERAQFDDSTHHVGLRHILGASDLHEAAERLRAAKADEDAMRVPRL